MSDTVAIPAGPALDVAVQRAVFGTKHLYCRYGEPWVDEQAFYIPSGKPWRTHHIDALMVPHYSEKIEAAWKLVDVVLAQWQFCLFQLADTTWCCEVGNEQGFGETPALAICRAALAVYPAPDMLALIEAAG